MIQRLHIPGRYISPRYEWAMGARERAALDNEPVHTEPTYPAAEHVASLADVRLLALIEGEGEE